MVVIATDTHKQSRTAAAVSEATWRAVADVTVRAKRRSFDDLLLWARGRWRRGLLLLVVLFVRPRG